MVCPIGVKFEVYHFSGQDLRDLAGSAEVSGLHLELLVAQVRTRSGGFLLVRWPIAIQHFVQSMVVAKGF